MARTKVTQLQANFSKTTDANGWTVYDYGNWKEYRKRITFSQTIAGLAVLTVSSTNLPVGVSNYTGHYFNYIWTATGNAGVLLIVAELGSTSATALQFTTATTDTISRSYSGWIDVSLVQA